MQAAGRTAEYGCVWVGERAGAVRHPGQDWDRFDPVWDGYNGSKSLQTWGNGASDEAEQGRM